MPEQPPVLTPSQLNTLARDLLESAFPLVWMEGELGNVTRPGSGHLYFTLKDARAQVRCAMFKPKSQWLKFVPREGLKVLGRGRLTLYEARGDYQLVFDHLEEAGEGALRRAFEALQARLAAEGLFDATRKRPLPTWVRRVAVITSPTGAAVRDVLSVLARRLPLLEVDVLPSLVQGESAAAQITDLLRLRARPQSAIARVLQRERLQLQALARSLEACSPLATVARGYSILTREGDGTLVHSTTQISVGERLQARLADGQLSLQVQAVHPAGSTTD